MNDDAADLIRVVLADANVLYSRVLRDYLLYAADQEVIAITWSAPILAEVTEHLELNVAGFDRAAGERLVRAMNRTFPFAEVDPTEEHWHMLDASRFRTKTTAMSWPQPSPPRPPCCAPSIPETSRPKLLSLDPPTGCGPVR